MPSIPMPKFGPAAASIVVVLMASLACGDSPHDDVVPSATAESIAADLLRFRPPSAFGLTLDQLMSEEGGGQFDCQSPDLADEPSLISHHRLGSIERQGESFVVTFRYFNEPETISQLATYAYDPGTGEITALDAHAGTFMNPAQPSDDDC